MSQGPYDIFVGTVSVTDPSGSGVSNQTNGTIDLGDARDKFTLSLGISDGAFGPAFTSAAATYIAAVNDNPGLTAGEPIPIPVGTVEVTLQGSLDGFSWYNLTSLGATLATLDGATVVAIPTETAVITGAPSPLARYLQAQVVFTLTGLENLSVEDHVLTSSATVTSVSAQLSIYVATQEHV